MNKKIIYLLFLFTFQTLIGQNSSKVFDSYEESQNWIKEIKSLKPNERKTKIIERIKFEQNSKNIKFELIFLFNGIPYLSAQKLPPKKIKILELIPENNLSIGHSICEFKGIYANKCNLGYVIISKLDKPLVNESNELKKIEFKRKRGKIILKFFSETETNINLKISDFFSGCSPKLILQKKVKKGNNRYVIKRTNNIQLIDANLNDKRLLILL